MGKIDPYAVANKLQQKPEGHEPPPNRVNSHATSSEPGGRYPQPSKAPETRLSTKKMPSDALRPDLGDDTSSTLPAAGPEPEQPKVQFTVILDFPPRSNSRRKQATTHAQDPALAQAMACGQDLPSPQPSALSQAPPPAQAPVHVDPPPVEAPSCAQAPAPPQATARAQVPQDPPPAHGPGPEEVMSLKCCCCKCCCRIM